MTNKLKAMISSTVRDMPKHRKEVLVACLRQEMFPVMMEHLPASDAQAISASLKMVDEASIYVGVFAHRYGYIPKENNPQQISITEMEYNRAFQRKIPRLIFIIDNNYKLADFTINDIDTGELAKKLTAFKSRIETENIANFFTSPADLRAHVINSLSKLKTKNPIISGIPAPPAFYAEPPYIGSHKFVGRKAELDRLSNWAKAADPHPVLLFEAIGGTGKSMLTWEWTTKHSPKVRKNWAGRFWYSFYEKGAIMADFCRRALAYMTRQSLEELQKMKTTELSEQLLLHLQSQPWLLILDGLERVLVAYHRYDAAQVADEEIDTSAGQIAKRDPYSTILPEDDDLLRLLAAANPSKLLITTRFTPNVLLNPAGQAIKSVLRVSLLGLRPADARELIRMCGITGNSKSIQKYLKTHCNCHPLVTGILAGLINNYLPDRGNFDAWVTDSTGGGQLNLANLDLVQKRNHILHAALAALSDKSRQLLSTLALLSDAVDYALLSAINPHMPPEPEKVEEPIKPEDDRKWETMSDNKKIVEQENYQKKMQCWREYEQALKTRLLSKEYQTAQQKLEKTVKDLERRGLLQYDHQSRRYDLHPVVRGVAVGSLQQEEKEHYGKLLVNYFIRQEHIPYNQAKSLEDVNNHINLIRVYLQMGRFKEAYATYVELKPALEVNLEASAVILSILRPFFPNGWRKLPDQISETAASNLIASAANALREIGESKEALEAYNINIMNCLRLKDWNLLLSELFGVVNVFKVMNCPAKEDRIMLFHLDLASLLEGEYNLFKARQNRFARLTAYGRLDEAEEMWQYIKPLSFNSQHLDHSGALDHYYYALFRFYQGTLEEKHIVYANELAKANRIRRNIRRLHRLKGEWYLEQGKWALAAKSLSTALSMAHEVKMSDKKAETMLAFAKFHLGQLPRPEEEAIKLAKSKEPSHLYLANLWLAIGDQEKAKIHAIEAYKWSWADGYPYVHHYYLNKARFLLEQLQSEIPNLPPYDPVKDEKLSWEDDVAAAIEKLKAEKKAEKNAK